MSSLFSLCSLPTSLQQPAWQYLSEIALPGLAGSADTLREPETHYGKLQGLPLQPGAGTPFPRTDHDGHWKDAMETWLRPCIALFWPELDALISWDIPPVFMSKELRRIGGSLYRDRRYVDLLAELHTTQQPALILLHTEIQARLNPTFARRMYHYYTRIQSRYPDHDILQFAIITQGKNPRKIRRLTYSYAPLNGNFLNLVYSTPVIHLQDWAGQEDRLRAIDASNPFALILLTELQATATQQHAKLRLKHKIELVRTLYQSNYTDTEIRQLFLFIDSTIRLQADQEPDFTHAIETIEKEQKVAYISSVERVWKKKWEEKGLQKGRQTGLQQGLQQGLSAQLQQRFGPLHASTEQRLQQASVTELQTWMLRILKAESLQDIFAN